jgi:shikimate dehydrogenase
MNAETKLIGIFGHPVGHSLSPLFMNVALKALGSNSVYLAFDVEERALGEAVKSLRSLGWTGANVTIPHKQAVSEFLDAVDEDARAIGAVNCIVNREGSLLGRNTDHVGFRASLDKSGFRLASIAAVLIGCGGAARGVLFALVRGGVRKVYLINRTESRARELAAWADDRLGFGGVEYVGDGRETAREGDGGSGPSGNAAIGKALAEASLVVNTTPVGMLRPGTTPDASPISAEAGFRAGCLVYDLTYNPRRTELLRRAEAGGASTMNGLPMLIQQGLHSLALWFPGRDDRIFSLEGKLLRKCARALERS